MFWAAVVPSMQETPYKPVSQHETLNPWAGGGASVWAGEQVSDPVTGLRVGGVCTREPCRRFFWGEGVWAGGAPWLGSEGRGGADVWAMGCSTAWLRGRSQRNRD